MRKCGKKKLFFPVDKGVAKVSTGGEGGKKNYIAYQNLVLADLSLRQHSGRSADSGILS